MTTTQKLFVSWQTIGYQIERLKEHLEGQKFDRIIGISRGGLPLGVSLSHRFNLPFSIVGVSSYNDLTNEQETLICDTPDVVFEGWEGKVLLVDDVSDTGATLKFLLDKTFANNPDVEVKIATLYYKEDSSIKPDFYVEETDRWIIFPWEGK